MEEEELWPLFDAALPEILGGVFDLLARALAIRPDVRLTSKPRMADAAAWGFAIAEAAGWGGLVFLAAYERNISRQAEEAGSSSVVAQVVVEFMDERDEWQGPASSLKPKLDEVAGAQGIETKDRKSGWPQDAPRLAKELRRLAETLTASGIEVTFPSQGKRRSVRFKTLKESTVGTVGSNGRSRYGEAGFPEGDSAPEAGGPPGFWADSADGTDGNEQSASDHWSEEL